MTPTESLPPGPSAPPALLMTRFLLRPTQFLDDCYRQHGDFFTVVTPERTICFLADPDAIKQVFTGDPELLHAGEGNAILAPMLGPRSVLVLDGPEHMRQRRLMLPSFHGERMASYGELMAEVAEREVERWPAGEPFVVLPSMQAITLEVIMRAVFGLEAGARRDELRSRLRGTLDRLRSRPRLVLLALTSSRRGARSPWGRFRAELAKVDTLLFDEIRARRADPEIERREDVLSLLVQARDEDGEPMSERELRDELMTLLVAGHETTATALAWTMERLARHPRVAERLGDELRETDDGEYLDAVVKEALRLRPVVPGVIRRLTAPMELKGYSLPAGVHVAPSIYLTHRRPDIYPDPLAFRPERFIEQPAGTYTWIPFGGGIRRCLGGSFAIFEMKAVLRAVMARHRIEPSSDRDEAVVRRAVTFVPSRGGRVRLAPAPAEARRPAAASAA